MSQTGEPTLDQSAAAHATALASAFARPVWIGLGLLGALCVAGWVFLAAMLFAMTSAMDAGDLGPGMGLFNAVGGYLLLSDEAQALLAAICRVGMPGPFGLAMPGEGAWNVAQMSSVLLMWIAMVGAMMLPSAAPMIRTYGEITETAHAKGKTIPSPMILIAGYVIVWIGAAFGFAVLQGVAAELGLLSGVTFTPVSLWMAAAVLGVAGLYQFSNLRTACLTKCRAPFNYFFANWTERPMGVLRHGLRQGLWCLGCCAGLMLVMFAVGLMNVLWMAALAIVMTVEKLIGGQMIARLTGAACLVAAVSIALVAV
ncbi:MAG: DUF2182 domain-containing protein [Pseudomonadota bacterium]